MGQENQKGWFGDEQPGSSPPPTDGASSSQSSQKAASPALKPAPAPETQAGSQSQAADSTELNKSSKDKAEKHKRKPSRESLSQVSEESELSGDSGSSSEEESDNQPEVSISRSNAIASNSQQPGLRKPRKDDDEVILTVRRQKSTNPSVTVGPDGRPVRKSSAPETGELKLDAKGNPILDDGSTIATRSRNSAFGVEEDALNEIDDEFSYKSQEEKTTDYDYSIDTLQFRLGPALKRLLAGFDDSPPVEAKPNLNLAPHNDTRFGMEYRPPPEKLSPRSQQAAKVAARRRMRALKAEITWEKMQKSGQEVDKQAQQNAAQQPKRRNGVVSPKNGQK